MKGFDAEFRDLDHYIRVITDRIWEGRRLEDIRRYYGEGCAVETASSVSIGIEPVIAGTRATLASFPDRRLLAEDVIVSGDEQRGFLSSHRIFSPMVHAGDGVFGPPTGRAVYVRTVADCVCIANRIVHEWLVRDQAAIARQIGIGERTLAQRWLDAAGGWNKPAMPPAPAPYVSHIDDSALARGWADSITAAWLGGGPGGDTHAAHVIAWLPGSEAAAGLEALRGFWRGVAAALPGAEIAIEHLALMPRPGRATPGAMRWRALAVHAGGGRYGEPSGRPVEVMGISHAEFEEGRIVREWHLIDDVATWMQVLEPRRGQGG